MKSIEVRRKTNNGKEQKFLLWKSSKCWYHGTKTSIICWGKYLVICCCQQTTSCVCVGMRMLLVTRRLQASFRLCRQFLHEITTVMCFHANATAFLFLSLLSFNHLFVHEAEEELNAGFSFSVECDSIVEAIKYETCGSFMLNVIWNACDGKHLNGARKSFDITNCKSRSKSTKWKEMKAQ